MKLKIFFFLCFCAVMTINFSCSDKFAENLRDKHIIPDIQLYTEVDLGIGGESNLQVPGQPLYLTTSRPYGKQLGYEGHGIIVIRLNDTEYACWDATCTKCENLTSYFTQQELEGELAICPECRTQFSLRYGSPFNQTEKIYPLKSYPVIKSGNRLIISN